MADLDFEELDRAINELYEELDNDDPEPVKESVSESHPEPVAKPVTKAVAVGGHEEVASHRPVVAEPKPIDVASQPAAAKPATAVANQPKPRKVMDMVAPKKKKPSVANAVAAATATSAIADAGSTPEKVKVSGKGGHFMDMINPAGDVSLKNKPNFAAQKQAKVKVAVKDDDTPAESVESSKPSKISIAVGDTDVEINKPAKNEESKVKSAQPAGRRATQFERPAAKHKVASLPATDLTPITDEDIVKSRKDPYEVPFLPDAQAKVEKRPLGQPMTTKTSDTDDLDKLAESLSNPVANEKPAKKVQPRSVEDKQESKGSDAGEQDKPSRRSRKERNSRPSETNYAIKRATKNYNRSQPTRIHHNRGLNILKWLLLFIFVIIAGALTGLALYYFGGM